METLKESLEDRLGSWSWNVEDDCTLRGAHPDHDEILKLVRGRTKTVGLVLDRQGNRKVGKPVREDQTPVDLMEEIARDLRR